MLARKRSIAAIMSSVELGVAPLVVTLTVVEPVVLPLTVRLFVTASSRSVFVVVVVVVVFTMRGLYIDV